jgi:cysteine synthase A
MTDYAGTLNAIGNTPLIKLKYASELTGCTILGKAEYANPGGSVKDRPALGIIEDAEKKDCLNLVVWLSRGRLEIQVLV